MAAKLGHYIKTYFLILGMSLRSRMSFRVDFFVMLGSIFLKEFANLSLLIIVVNRFENLAGWSMWEMAFLYSVVTFTQRNFSSFLGGFVHIGELIKSGEMDTYVMTPLSPLFLINSRQTMVWRIYYNISILAMLIFCGVKAGIAFTPLNTLMFIVMMISAMFIMAAVMLGVSSIAFFTVDISNATAMIDEIVRKYMIYPISIYGKIASFLLTFVIPLAFISYYPAAYLLGKAESVMFSPHLAVLTPVFAVVFFALALLLWRWGIKNYKSTGT
ncbi:MAG: ABC-2 family transporter protein [Oscillospiraceae bacterium]|nr:ABC-2 family transporter protein [Oscillospiraceae bacterium]